MGAKKIIVIVLVSIALLASSFLAGWFIRGCGGASEREQYARIIEDNKRLEKSVADRERLLADRNKELERERSYIASIRIEIQELRKQNIEFRRIKQESDEAVGRGQEANRIAQERLAELERRYKEISGVSE